MSEKNIYLCSFASPDLFASKYRFKRQLDKFGVYKDYKVFSYSNLSVEGKNFIKLCKKQNDLRGFGYWFWKPLIVKEYLKTLPENAILQYCDIGSVFNDHSQTKKDIIYELSEKCILHNMVAFNYSRPLQIDPYLLDLAFRLSYQERRSNLSILKSKIKTFRVGIVKYF